MCCAVGHLTAAPWASAHTCHLLAGHTLRVVRVKQTDPQAFRHVAWEHTDHFLLKTEGSRQNQGGHAEEEVPRSRGLWDKAELRDPTRGCRGCTVSYVCCWQELLPVHTLPIHQGYSPCTQVWVSGLLFPAPSKDLKSHQAACRDSSCMWLAL